VGMFDTVLINCRKCGAELEVQTKTGPCTLATYRLDNVPIDVAEGLDGKGVWCEHCDNHNDIVLKVIALVI
jgi:hypothetical protein